MPAVPCGEAAEFLLSVLREELTGETFPMDEGMSEAVVSKMLTLAKRHDLGHLVADYLLRYPLSEELKSDCKTAKASAQYRYFQQTQVLSAVSKTFEKHGIDFIPLKGSVLRGLYPAPWMRSCSDIDILVHEEDISRALELAETEIGMKRGFHGSHDYMLRYMEKVTVELHFRLLEDDAVNGASRILEDCWDHTTSDSHCKQMTDEMFYLYHICHMAKHFEYGGCGIRFFMDLWLLDHKTTFDREKRDALLQKAGLLGFAGKAREISEKWFSGTETEGTEHIERFIVQSGSFGRMSKNVSIGKHKKGGAFGYVKSRVFVPYDYLCILYPSLKKHRALTPVYEVVRWFRFIKPGSRAHTLAELNHLMKDSDTDAITVLKDMGLLYDGCVCQVKSA